MIYSAVAPFSRRKCDNAGEVPVAFAVRAPGSTIGEDEVKEYIAQQVDLDPFLIFLILFYFAHLLLRGLHGILLFDIFMKAFQTFRVAVFNALLMQVVFYKKLHGVYFIDSIPKSAAGKILRKDLRNKC